MASVREKTRETSRDRAKSAREREREIESESERERERESARARETEYDQMGVFAGSGSVWQSFIFYHSFYTLS